ncbi:MAG: D-alanyl-D-alanine carboxypeptidase [Acidobacteria bacterium]|nr:D-alanyl-D-alanine carboxypeptidase [Acidobacteriota bacterium]
MLLPHFTRCAGFLLSLLALLLAPPLAAMPAPQAPEIQSKSHILLDFHSGQELAQSNADERVEPASLTKLMTAYLVFTELVKGNLKLDDLLQVSETAWRTGGSRMFIEVGTQVRAEDLIRGMIIQSGNDATLALAEHIGGTEQAFADYMNQAAKQLGMTGSHFINAYGWPAPNHYTTARDIALLARAIIRDFPQYYPYYSQQEFTYNGITQYNRNRLLGREAGVDGMKTGFTDSAGYCLVTSAQRGEMRLVSVVIGTRTVKQRHAFSSALLNYGFRFFETHKLFDGTHPLDQVPVWKGNAGQLPVGPSEPIYVTTQRGQKDALAVQAELRPSVVAPVQAGTELGKLTVSLEGKVIRQTPVYALQTVEAGPWWRRLVDEARLRIQ